MQRRRFVSGALAAFGAAATAGRVGAWEAPQGGSLAGPAENQDRRYGLTYAPGDPAPPPDEFIVGEVVSTDSNSLSIRFGREVLKVDARSAVVWQGGVVYPGAVSRRVRKGDRVEVAGRRRGRQLVVSRAFVLDPPLAA